MFLPGGMGMETFIVTISDLVADVVFVQSNPVVILKLIKLERPQFQYTTEGLKVF